MYSFGWSQTIEGHLVGLISKKVGPIKAIIPITATPFVYFHPQKLL